jgi:hypothetical protein
MPGFHSYPLRWSVGNDGKRSRSRVVTIICRAIRWTGRPYTQRILPEHLIPRSPFSSEGLVKLLEGGRDRDPGFTDAACEALGCVDPRTARKHLRFVRAAVEAKLPVLTELLASAPGPSEGQYFPPGTNPFAILCLLWDKFLKSAQELSGSLVAFSLRPLLWLGPGLELWRCFNRSCIPIPVPP